MLLWCWLYETVSIWAHLQNKKSGMLYFRKRRNLAWKYIQSKSSFMKQTRNETKPSTISIRTAQARTSLRINTTPQTTKRQTVLHLSLCVWVCECGCVRVWNFFGTCIFLSHFHPVVQYIWLMSCHCAVPQNVTRRRTFALPASPPASPRRVKECDKGTNGRVRLDICILRKLVYDCQWPVTVTVGVPVREREGNKNPRWYNGRRVSPAAVFSPASQLPLKKSKQITPGKRMMTTLDDVGGRN